MAYRSTTTKPAQRLDAALMLLRIVIGGIFIAHGAQKLFVFGVAGVVGAFGQMGVPLPGITGPAIAFLEFFGGIALVLGLFTRPLGLLLAVDMLGAIALVKVNKGFFLPDGYEFELSLLGAALALALTGAGEYSLDRILATRKAEGRRHG
jgi:putative oxidoreductase